MIKPSTALLDRQSLAAGGVAGVTKRSKAQGLRHNAHERPNAAQDVARPTGRSNGASDIKEVGEADSATVVEGSARFELKGSGGIPGGDGASSQGATGTATGQTGEEVAHEESASAARVEDAREIEPADVHSLVERVFDAVDPALSSRMAGELRQSRNVAASARDAMRSTVDAQRGSSGEVPAHGAQSGEASGVEPVEPLKVRGEAIADASSGRAIDQQVWEIADPGEQLHAHQPDQDPAGGAQPDRRSTEEAVGRMATGVDRFESRLVGRGGEGGQTVAVLAVAGAQGGRGRGLGFGVDARAGVTEQGSQAGVAQQVRHGLEVALHELPAPSGERLVMIKLNPSAMGSLRIALSLSGDSVSIRFSVGSARAKASIDETIDELREMVEGQGLRIDSMTVEEDRALAAPQGRGEGESRHDHAPEARAEANGAAGKGFAKAMQQSSGAESPGAAAAGGGGPGSPGVDMSEGGVLQVLTFRLDAVG